MHKQQPQTAYRKDAVLTGTIFENCDKKEDIMQGFCVMSSLAIKRWILSAPCSLSL
jgi:hypothetical protein